MRNLRKRAAMMLCVVLSIGILAGCSGGRLRSGTEGAGEYVKGGLL